MNKPPRKRQKTAEKVSVIHSRWVCVCVIRAPSALSANILEDLRRPNTNMAMINAEIHRKTTHRGC